MGSDLAKEPCSAHGSDPTGVAARHCVVAQEESEALGHGQHRQVVDFKAKREFALRTGRGWELLDQLETGLADAARPGCALHEFNIGHDAHRQGMGIRS